MRGKIMQPKVSVIVPIYNAEKYLRECLDSVVNQTLRDIEIICVNDGSTDYSLGVLKDYEKKDDRIRVFSQENAGAGIARNHGLKHAKGEYVSFVDSDDWLELDALEKTYQNAKVNDSDLVFFNAIEHYPDRVRNRICFPDNAEYAKGIFSYKDNRNLVLNSSLVVWNKLHRTKFLRDHNLQFQDFPVNEDVPFHIQSTLLAERITYVPENLYHYRRDEPGSLQSTTVKSQKGIAILEVFKTIESFLTGHGCMDDFETNFLKFKFRESEIRLNEMDELFKEEFYRLLRDDFKKMNISSDTIKQVPVKECSFFTDVLQAGTYEDFNMIHKAPSRGGESVSLQPSTVKSNRDFVTKSPRDLGVSPEVVVSLTSYPARSGRIKYSCGFPRNNFRTVWIRCQGSCWKQ